VSILAFSKNVFYLTIKNEILGEFLTFPPYQGCHRNPKLGLSPIQEKIMKLPTRNNPAPCI